MHYGFAIDTTRCIGCNTCAVGCKNSNNLPNGMWWNRILTDGGDWIDTARGQFPNNLHMVEYPIMCQHCENPACVRACPVGATYKDPETGVVRQDADKCIGCRMCIASCPYTGIRSFNWEEPKFALDFAQGDPDTPRHQKHTVEKCTMCWPRLARGEEPYCVKICPAEARIWGDLDDPDSDVSRAIATHEYTQFLTEMGTKPSVYYLI